MTASAPVTLPSSDLLSPEFNRHRAEYVVQSLATLVGRLPQRTATKAEWDRFDSWLDEHYNAQPLAKALKLYPVDVAETRIAGVRVAVVTPRAGVTKANEGRVLIHLHGGGFVFHRGLNNGLLEAVPVAAIGRVKIITLDYRQAPFHRYPAASEDVEAVYREVLSQHEPAQIGIFGSSAGAVLACQALARFQSVGLPVPAAVGIFCMAPPPPFPSVPPWESGWGESGFWFTGDAQPSEYDRRVWQAIQWYMEEADSDDPLAYPGMSDQILSKFPPTLFLSGTRDYAVSTVLAAHARFLRLGVQSSLYVMEAVGHTEHLAAVGTPEAHGAHEHTARFFNQTLA